MAVWARKSLNRSRVRPAASLVPTEVEPGLVPATEVTLCWDTFTAAVEEAGLSRLYGGTHFRQGNEAGLTLGRQVGQRVWEEARGVLQRHSRHTSRFEVEARP